MEIEMVKINEIEQQLPKMTQQEYNKQYYESNKNKIRDGQKTKICCPKCGSKVNFQNLTKHIKTNICNRKVNKNTELLRGYKELYESLGLEFSIDIIDKMMNDIKTNK